MASIEEPIKSKPGGEQLCIRFFNRTKQPIDIIWKSFKGENIRYASRLAPKDSHCVTTFVSHPWQAWNSDTLNILNIGGSTVFYPTKLDGQGQDEGDWINVFIDEPVHTLLGLCLERVKSLVNLEDSDTLDIPRILIEELKKRRSAEVQNYISRGRRRR